jgi:hypothetical protein
MKFGEVKNLEKSSGSHDGDLGGASLSNSFLPGILGRSIDGDLDGDGSSANILALKSLNCLLLLDLVPDINKTVTLTLTGASILSANDASRDDIDAGISEQGSEGNIIDVETEIGDKEHRLGGFAGGLFACSTAG